MRYLISIVIIILINSSVYADKCQDLIREGKLTEAKQCYTTIKNPVSRLTGLGMWYTVTLNYTEALECYRKAYEIDPDRLDLRYAYGLALITSCNRHTQLKAEGKIRKLH